ncbi:MAG: Lrp/AsnC family transcriptional regulator [Gammaproteobacteria bacterium]|nr:Lrp/AsnC family transcriptional regulator [Gammaproteobacteria bacterium]MCP5199047.1 Lrp/AsnC family transcriptional regulator [Gammaproteobacteria bacterium]
MKIDPTDRAILTALQADGRMTNVQLAERVHLSESACLRRVRLLEAHGVIARYTMLVDPVAVGIPGNVFAEITLVSQQQQDLDRFEAAVREVPEVMECYLVTGEYDYLLRVVARDTVDYERIHHQHLTKLPGVARVKSSFTLRTVAKKTELPLA